jgi:hypothetical protein
MQIKAEHVESKKRIGKLKGKPVIEIKTTGGFHMVVTSNESGGFETLGTGPHKAVARHIAQKREPEIEWVELSKSDHVDPAHFQHLLPEYETLTNRLRELQGV